MLAFCYVYKINTRLLLEKLQTDSLSLQHLYSVLCHEQKCCRDDSCPSTVLHQVLGLSHTPYMRVWGTCRMYFVRCVRKPCNCTAMPFTAGLSLSPAVWHTAKEVCVCEGLRWRKLPFWSSRQAGWISGKTEAAVHMGLDVAWLIWEFRNKIIQQLLEKKLFMKATEIWAGKLPVLFTM